MPNQQQQNQRRRERRRAERERAQQRAQQQEARREEQRARRELAEEAGVDRDQVTRDDDEIRLTEEGEQRVRDRQRREAAAEIDDEIDLIDVTEDDVTRDDDEIRLTDDAEQRFQDRQRREAVDELDAEISQIDVTDDDVRLDGDQFVLRSDAQSELETQLEREARRDAMRSRQAQRRSLARDLDDEIDDVDISVGDIRRDGDDWVLSDSVQSEIGEARFDAQDAEGPDIGADWEPIDSIDSPVEQLRDAQREARRVDREGQAAELAEQLDEQTDTRVFGPRATPEDMGFRAGQTEITGDPEASVVQLEAEDLAGGELSRDVVDEIEEIDRERAVAQTASELGLRPDQLEIDTEQEFVQDAFRQEPGAEIDTQQRIVPTREAQEELLTQEVTETADVDAEAVDIVETDRGLQAEIDDQRETWVGRQLEGASDRWQSAAESVGDFARENVPGTVDTSIVTSSAVSADPRVTPDLFRFEEDLGDVTGRAAELGIGTFDIPGLALTAGDTARSTARGYEGWGDFRAERAEDLLDMDFDEFLSRDGASAALDATTGAGWFADRGAERAVQAGDAGRVGFGAAATRPLETAASGGAILGASIAGPTAAARGAQRLGQWQPGARTREMLGDDRGQMELTVQRERTRDASQQPADPTGTTPAERAPPRDAFPSEEAYQQALRRQEERLVQEMVDSTPTMPDATASPTERVRAMRDEFGSQAEFQRELQRARELEQAGAQTEATAGAALTAGAVSGDGQQFAEADLFAPPSSDVDAELSAAFGDPSQQLEAEADLFAEPDTDRDATAAFGDPSQQLEAEAQLFAEPATGEATAAFADTTQAVDTQATLDVGVTADMASPMALDTAFGQTTQATATGQTQAMAQAMGMDQLAGQRTATRGMTRAPPRSAGRLGLFGFDDDRDRDPFGFDTEFGEARFDTGFAEADDVVDDDWFGGSGGDWFDSDSADDWFGDVDENDWF